jgi:hypothetical protein
MTKILNLPEPNNGIMVKREEKQKKNEETLLKPKIKSKMERLAKIGAPKIPRKLPRFKN